MGYLLLVMMIRSRKILLIPCNQFTDSKTGVSGVVDIFNIAKKSWAVAFLSTPREQLAATSLPGQAIALFAGGYGPEGGIC
jgi:hypothetical protein